MWKALILSAGITLAAVPAQAQTSSIQDRIVEALGQEGYREVSVTRTWLGRLRFVAEKPGAEREIVVNPNTGVVLRDYERVLIDDDDEDGGWDEDEADDEEDEDEEEEDEEEDEDEEEEEEEEDDDDDA
ncbi:MAG: hypothetical protein QNJ35_15310 [Paracoccaceae bacterium]|nr:hypothetical protein [Paracoccaceae bacterium]